MVVWMTGYSSHGISIKIIWYSEKSGHNIEAYYVLQHNWQHIHDKQHCFLNDTVGWFYHQNTTTLRLSSLFSQWRIKYCTFKMNGTFRLLTPRRALFVGKGRIYWHNSNYLYLYSSSSNARINTNVLFHLNRAATSLCPFLGVRPACLQWQHLCSHILIHIECHICPGTPASLLLITYAHLS